jgi:hypothetical protein
LVLPACVKLRSVVMFGERLAALVRSRGGC